MIDLFGMKIVVNDARFPKRTLTAAKQAQPERDVLMACHCFDDIARRYCIDKNRCSRCEAYGIKQGGQHD